MTQWVSMPVGGGDAILFETDADAGVSRAARGNQPVGRGPSIEQASESVQEALQRIRPAAEAVLAEFRAMEQRPSKISLQFGIKVTGEANLAIAKTAGEANFTVSMEWTAPSS
ncbi:MULTISPECIES: CU044_2847 family protein [Amycolatopsis]|uniref:CU044_2847 family protein n=1 Tax=Amycolatopsis TaxID=1813 RepID=UPI0005682C53|nr:CU044_2847 family protein [Amycolatopsis nivea]